MKNIITLASALALALGLSPPVHAARHIRRLNATVKRMHLKLRADRHILGLLLVAIIDI